MGLNGCAPLFCLEKHKKNAYFDAPKRDQNSFTVKHYAGAVTYAVAGFREKNKDTLFPDMVELIKGSSNAVAASLKAAPANS